jgi:hypothetical protein
METKEITERKSQYTPTNQGKVAVLHVPIRRHRQMAGDDEGRRLPLPIRRFEFVTWALGGVFHLIVGPNK